MVRRLFSSFVPRLALLASFSTAPVAAAPLEGRTGLGLDSTVLSYESFTATSDAGSASRSTTTLGVGGPGLGFGIGYGASENVLIGGRVLYQSSSEGGEGPSVSSNAFAALLEPEFVFDGEEARPFLGAVLGYRSVASESGGAGSSASLARLGASAGVHWFVLERASIDPKISFAYETGSGHAGAFGFDRSGFSIGIGFGISAWLGGEEPAATVPAVPGSNASAPAISDEDSGARITSTTTDTSDSVDAHATIALEGHGRVVFRPSNDGGGSVETAFLFPRTAALESCAVLDVEGTKTAFQIAVVSSERLEHGSSSLVALRAAIPRESAQAIARAKGDVTLDGCGERAVLGDTAKAVLRRFSVGRPEREAPLSGR